MCGGGGGGGEGLQGIQMTGALRGNPCIKLGMMSTQKNVEMTATHMNYRVSKKLIFKWQGCLREMT